MRQSGVRYLLSDNNMWHHTGPMTNTIHKVTLRERRTADDLSRLEAILKENGDLVLEGYDLGDVVKEAWGDDDYEYWLTVNKEHVLKVLLELIKDQFTTSSGFRKWLESKDIPSEFDSW